jgi:hypothetical protein
MRKHALTLCLLSSGSFLAAATMNDFTVHCTNGNIDANDQVAVVGCLLAGGGSFTGTVNVVKNDTQVLITLTGGGAVPGMFTGTSTGIDPTTGMFVPIVTTPYFLLGEGIERASFSGMLSAAGDTTNGAEFFEESVFGTSFNPPIPADTKWTGPGAGVNLPISVASGPATVEGLFQGSGTAQVFVRFNTGGGTAFTFPSSVDGALAVPEPSSVWLTLPAFGLLILTRRRRNRYISQRHKFVPTV